MTWLYLDHNATTQPLPQVVEAMLPWLSTHYGNPSSSHPLGRQAREALVNARASVAAFLQVTPAEVVFTSGATESNHLAILAALAARPERRQIVTSAVEHTSTRLLLAQLAKQGVEVVEIGVDAQGQLSMPELLAAVGPHTALVSLMHANHETGVIFPVAEVAEIAHRHGALMHVDAAQSAGKLALDMAALGCDLLGFSAHKLYAAKGTGVLYVKKGLSLQPMLWGNQERHRRGGTENLPGIVGLATACDVLGGDLATHASRMAALRDQFEQAVLRALPAVEVNGGGPRVANTSHLCFAGLSADSSTDLNGEALLLRLEKQGVLASRGSACSAGGNQPSHVLLAMGRSEQQALCSLRFSLGIHHTAADMQQLLAAVVTSVRQLQLQQAA
ncbi:cysteine desulfurase family protein [Methylophilus sp. YYY-1]|uniref:cysteine desulfurase family protein n=1 Tax=Methylophilus sp. YYY-1 TaxID=2682087 RepID=UPI0023B2CC5E|nr:cysteine desulfurase family protein [Methylophilus sp. YYY-1]MDF0378688.1 aminotransferase class V-fold PLP-dependent enzyme [Methylophilus sp. YYY-1]